MIHRTFASIRYVPTAAARSVFGDRLGVIAGAAFRAIVKEKKGLDIAHLQFRLRKDLVAIRSRATRNGEVEIEIDVGNEKLPAVSFTEEELAAARRDYRGPRREAPSRHRTEFHLVR